LRSRITAGSLRENCRRLCCIIDDYRFVSAIAYRVLPIPLRDDVPGAVGKGLLDKVMAVVSCAFDRDENISVLNEPRIGTNTQAIFPPD